MTIKVSLKKFPKRNLQVFNCFFIVGLKINCIFIMRLVIYNFQDRAMQFFTLQLQK